ncbi:MAG: cadherin repeat domain-containing protein, partial [Gemmobacter sp.]
MKEQSPANTPIGEPLEAGDPDVGQMVFFTLVGGNEGEPFMVDPCSGQLMVADPTLNYRVRNEYNITVRVTDNGAPPLHAEAWVLVRLIHVNMPPTMPDYEREVEELSPVGTPVGAPVTGTDPDPGQTLTYTLRSGNVNSAFAVHAHTAQITVANAVLDYETRIHY